MAQSQSKVKQEYRQCLYFNLYKYRVTIDIDNIQKLRYYEWYHEYINYQATWAVRNEPLTNRDVIDRYFEIKDTAKDCRFRIEYGRLYIYSNDLQFLEHAVDHINSPGASKFYSAIAPLQKDTIEFVRQPKYKYRNYFRAIKVDQQFKTMMLNFIESQQSLGAKVDISSSMKHWLNQQYSNPRINSYLDEYYYIEYDDERLEAVFGLLFGEYLKSRVFMLVQRTPTE